jgi:hypothetical protein
LTISGIRIIVNGERAINSGHAKKSAGQMRVTAIREVEKEKNYKVT